MSTRETQACGRNWEGPTLAPSHDARGGRSQFRIRFTTNTNTDGAIDFVAFYSGDFATATSRPRLTITYDYP